MDEIKFQERLELLCSSWDNFKNQNLWKNTNILLVYTHHKCKSLISSSFFNWLFGYNYPNTLLVISTKYFHIICEENSKDILQPLEKYVVLRRKVIVKGKGRDQLADSLNDVLKKVMFGNLPPPMSRRWIELGSVVGYIQAEGNLLSSQFEKETGIFLQWKDVTKGFRMVMTSNDSSLKAFAESEVGIKGMGGGGKDGKDGENKSVKDPLKEVEDDDNENDSSPDALREDDWVMEWKDVTKGFRKVMTSNDWSLDAFAESEVGNKGIGEGGKDSKDGENKSVKDPLKEVEEDDNEKDASSDALKEDGWVIVGNQKIEKADMQNE